MALGAVRTITLSDVAGADWLKPLAPPSANAETAGKAMPAERPAMSAIANGRVAGRGWRIQFPPRGSDALSLADNGRHGPDLDRTECSRNETVRGIARSSYFAAHRMGRRVRAPP